MKDESQEDQEEESHKEIDFKNYLASKSLDFPTGPLALCENV